MRIIGVVLTVLGSLFVAEAWRTILIHHEWKLAVHKFAFGQDAEIPAFRFSSFFDFSDMPILAYEYYILAVFFLGLGVAFLALALSRHRRTVSRQGGAGAR